MPTSFDPDSGSAVTAARVEAEQWIELARRWRRETWDDVVPSELAVVGFFDPGSDLDRRARQWGHQFTGRELADLAAFSAGLAAAEADGWETGDHPLATRTYTARRMLLGDRLLHWAVPWLDAMGRCYPQRREAAFESRDVLLAFGDRLRPTPVLTGSEGLVPPGEDSFGPTGVDADLDRYLRSVWSGVVVLDATVRSLTAGQGRGDLLGDPGRERDLATLYDVAAARWRGFIPRHPGSARLWADLADRAERTAGALNH
jgi:hypothetical protein